MLNHVQALTRRFFAGACCCCLKSLTAVNLTCNNGSDRVCPGRLTGLMHLWLLATHVLQVYTSFGGLLMKLRGDPSKLAVLVVDSKVYLLMRKV